MASKAAKPAVNVLRKWVYNKSGFNQYGLKFHDAMYETPEVKEALRRLPQKIVDERNFRIIRALQLSMQKIVLPKDQWQKYEEDDYYLKDLLAEVEKEKAERDQWAKK